MTSSDDPARRLADLDRVEGIKRLKYRYLRACDAKDAAAFLACFVRSGARIDYGPLGAYDDAAPLAAIFERVARHTVDGEFAVFDMHHAVHPEITVTSATTATGAWTLQFRQINLLDRTETLMTGEYRDEYVVEDGGWRMSASTLTERWRLRRPLGPEATLTPGVFP